MSPSKELVMSEDPPPGGWPALSVDCAALLRYSGDLWRTAEATTAELNRWYGDLAAPGARNPGWSACAAAVTALAGCDRALTAIAGNLNALSRAYAVAVSAYRSTEDQASRHGAVPPAGRPW
jgi:hypothetical protein